MKTIRFTKLRWFAVIFSVFTLVFCFYQIFFVHKSFARDIDFSGGLNITIKETEIINSEKLKNILKEYNIPSSVIEVQKDVETLLKIEINTKGEKQLENLAKQNKNEIAELGITVSSVGYLRYIIMKSFQVPLEKVEFISVNQVGPTVGRNLFRSSMRLLIIALLLITIYITFRFRVTFAVAATSALLHDAFITVGFIGLLQVPLSIPIIAAILAILGYSINDTIVIFDRIRENMGKEENVPLAHIIDQSITESLPRTLITSITTLFVVVAIHLYAGANLKPMSLVLIIGIISGTYSSAFIAAPVLLFFKKHIMHN